MYEELKLEIVLTLLYQNNTENIQSHLLRSPKTVINLKSQAP